MQLILITPETNAAEETEVINSFFARGLQRLHIRKPTFTDTDHSRYIDRIDRQFHHRLVLHSAFRLFNEYGLGGIHLNSKFRVDDRTWREVSDIPPDLISTSFHSWQEIEDNTFPYRYVFISPVFDSISKQGYKAGIDLHGAALTRRKMNENGRRCPGIMGLGGVGAPQIGILKEHGFDGAALLGSIWGAPDPVLAFQQCLVVG
jgi:thiamine-phosphate pyrophosphorylase